MKMIKYPSIEQFRNVVKEVQHNAQYVGKDEAGNPIMDRNAKMPVLKFIGSPKAHGTNGSLVLTSDGEYYAESRERILSLEADNAGFFVFAMQNKDFFESLLRQYLVEDVKAVSLSGEWCGGVIQKGVAITGLPKMFLPFGLKLVYEDEEANKWAGRIELLNFHNPDINVYPIDIFKTWEIDIDFNEPEYAQNKIAKWVDDVENECPIGAHFGQIGIGEGIVFESDLGIRFKAKGSKHSASKVKVIASCDVDAIESAKQFAEYAVTENRMRQGITVMSENGIYPSSKTIGHFLKWISGDVFKEESDTIIASDIDTKLIAKHIQSRAKSWFIMNYF